jgi:hypothetical protein
MKELKNRKFKLWAYTVSHSFLILRSPLKFSDEEGYSDFYDYNIDIEFSAVAYLDIPNMLRDIQIHELSINVPKKLEYYKKKLGFKVFEIQSESNFYYIVAGGYRIGKNKWISEDRIQDMSLEYDEILITTASNLSDLQSER